MSDRYPFAEIEPKWQRVWQEQRLFRAVDLDPARKKLYVLDMFPYPSGAGLHVGHPEGYTATDIFCRFKRMQGFNVLHPMGWDAFGLPAEQYAIDTGTHPAITTRKNIETFRRQIARFGFSYDWDRELDTTDPGYVKWTQWIFLKLHDSWFNPERNQAESISTLVYPHDGMTNEEKKRYRDGRRLAYLASAWVWWCTSCGTVLANEEVVDGKCERKGHPVWKQPMRQWMLRITAYAERLLADLDGLDWPEHIKQMQRNWIGRSEGAEVWFALAAEPPEIPQACFDDVRVRCQRGRTEFKIFTTRPDTLFGATYMVLAPEHPLVHSITAEARRQVVEAYQQDAVGKSELERTELAKEKTGVFTGAYAINPVNQERIPIWIADYVLASYGTGAIMAVPAHDQRDLEFALQYGLDVRIVIMPQDRPLELAGMTQAFEEDGRMHDSGPFTGLPSQEGSRKIVEWLSGRGLGQAAIHYKLRDWLFSRQRYWGEPIPLIHCQQCDDTVPLKEDQLPLRLPEMTDFTPGQPIPGFERESSRVYTMEAPLARVQEWVNTRCPRCNGPAKRETNTMPQWAGSCWYYLRYLDPRNDRQAWDPERERYWMPVDLYVGGAEHAVLHLLYSRFWHKVLYDLALVSTPEPFARLINQGLILGEDGEKMSKSRGNVVNPDDVIAEHGADAFRLYEMFMGPLEAVKPWSTRSIEGVDRFLQRVWRLGELVRSPQSVVHSKEQDSTASALERKRHETIKRVTEDLESLRLNTAIAAMMEFLNAIYESISCQESAASAALIPHTSLLIRQAFETLVLLLAPLAPHIAEELWQRLGHAKSLAYEPWPSYEAAALEQATILWIIQVNGKVRARLTLPAEISSEELKATVLADAQIKRFVDGQPIKQVIIVPKRLVNIVV